MSVRLLTDEEVQNYLDGNLDYAGQMEVERLIRGSRENEVLVESYRGLFGRLTEPELFGSKPNPHTVPLDQLVVTHHRSAMYSALTGIAIGVMALAGIFALIYFVDFSAFWRMLAAASLPTATISLDAFFDRLMAPVWQLSDGRAHQILFLLAAGSVLMLTRWFDAVLVQSRFKRLTRGLTRTR